MPDNLAPSTPDPIEYSPSFAVKKVLWSLASWKTAVPAGIAMAPVATTFIEHLSAMTSSFGITLHINQPVFESMLPVVIFAGIVSAHDFAKVKFQDKEIAKKIL